MIIAIDLDGVLFDTEEYYRTYAHLYDIEVVKNGLKDKAEMDVHFRHAWNNEVANEFYAKYTELVLSTAPLKPGAKYVVQELKKLGHTLICVTLRGYYRECEIPITEKRLKEEGIEFDKIYYCQKNKLQICQQEKVDVIVDDSHNMMNLFSGSEIKCLHFRGAGLREAENTNVVEVQNWGDVYEQILKITK